MTATRKSRLSTKFRSRTIKKAGSKRKQELLGYLVVEFRSEKLISDVFHQRIRKEFNIIVQDKQSVLYRYAIDADPRFNEASIRAQHSFIIRNRTWHVTIVPYHKKISLSMWKGGFAVTLFGMQFVSHDSQDSLSLSPDSSHTCI